MGRGQQSAEQTGGTSGLLYGPRKPHSIIRPTPARELNWLQFNQAIGQALKKKAIINGSLSSIKKQSPGMVISLGDGSEVRIDPIRDQGQSGITISVHDSSGPTIPGASLTHFQAGPSLDGAKFGGATSDRISRLIAPELEKQRFNYIDLRNNLDSIEAHRRLGYRVQIGGGYQSEISEEMEREEIMTAIRAHQRFNRSLSPQQNDQVSDLVRSLTGPNPTVTLLNSALGRDVLLRPIHFRVHLDRNSSL